MQEKLKDIGISKRTLTVQGAVINIRNGQVYNAVGSEILYSHPSLIVRLDAHH